jgi:hypothetical protein
MRVAGAASSNTTASASRRTVPARGAAPRVVGEFQEMWANSV